MTEKEALELFEQIGVLKKGHFKLSSGKHSDTYLQCAILQQYPYLHAKVIQMLADKVKMHNPSVVVGAAVGGIVSSYELGRLLGLRSIFAERVEGALTFRRGYALFPDDKPVLLEDVITTAKTTRELIDLVKSHQTTPVSVATIVDRQHEKTASIDEYPFFSAVRVEAVLFDPENCPLCLKNVPIDEPGSRRMNSKS